MSEREQRGEWKWRDTPSTTIAGDPRITAREHHFHGEQNSTSFRLTLPEMAVLQTYPPFELPRSTMRDYSQYKVLDLFAGTGVGVAIQNLGAEEYGVEIMKEALATREANGMNTIYNDVWDAHLFVELWESWTAEEKEFFTLWASPPCFTAGAPVVTEQGIKAIEDVVVGDRVLTHEGRWRAVTATMNREAETVTFGNITSTADHPFYAARMLADGTLGEPEWVDAQDTQGLYLATPINAGLSVDAAPSVKWRIAGRWAAGSRRIRDDDGWLAQTFGSTDGARTIPGWFLAQPTDVRSEFLAGFLAEADALTSTGWELSVVGVNLATGIALVAESLGFITTLIQSGGDMPYWTVTVKRGSTCSTVLHRWSQQEDQVLASGTQTVYDITVDEDHSFVCWGYVVHNCQAFSLAGSGAGRKALDDVLGIISRKQYIDMAELREQSELLGDPRIGLVLSPLHYAARFMPTYLAFEQVPPVLPVWEAMAGELRELGYSVWTGLLHSEQFGNTATCPLHATLNASIAMPSFFEPARLACAGSAGTEWEEWLASAPIVEAREKFVKERRSVASARIGLDITSTMTEALKSAFDVALTARAVAAYASDVTWQTLASPLLSQALEGLRIMPGRAGAPSMNADTYTSESTERIAANIASLRSSLWDDLCELAKSFITSTGRPTTTSPGTSPYSKTTDFTELITSLAGGAASCGACDDHAVPQTRKRAILMARRDGVEVTPPVPTHSKYHNRTPEKLDEGVRKWVSMAEALNWGMNSRPYFTLAGGVGGGGVDPACIGGSGARRSLNAEKAEGRWADDPKLAS